jgi:putative glutamine amidotransferase
MKPLIGITTSRRRGWFSFAMHRLALWRAGGKAIRLVAGEDYPVENLAGLIIGGGDDIGAELYNGQVLPDVRLDPARDALEFALLRKVLPWRLPVLGVCRGAQVINVALGGTLHADIYEIYEKAPVMRTVLPRKSVMLEKDSRVYSVLRCNPCRVNALHHQAVKVLGDGLRVVGRDTVGIVQAIETLGDEFLIGVQWHPELLPHLHSQQRLFGALIAAARDRVAARA